ncbi:dihydroneopterin aldolase [Paracoccus sp. DMF-8]|uniref:dihydroneopterin aldolase n=1 Tax=Paracoccus sp. DMF-8 TaxID=3019445 RepID=UPI0023E3A5CD|nr:dihydroneopterin aldolase [Paracoccus sp. DMF-8]MDF3607798.1 dihydroneopterin aldolase [Paracoccus sp. DMF-8]
MPSRQSGGHDQRLSFSLTVDLATPVKGVNDEVDRILSYDILIGAITAGLADRRHNLLETLAEKIAAQVLDHPRAARIEGDDRRAGPGARRAWRDTGAQRGARGRRNPSHRADGSVRRDATPTCPPGRWSSCPMRQTCPCRRVAMTG